ncbi:MAG: LysR family transcriptional regulator [Pseudomonadota bacterium]|nr:LysR family transcriptional regulator [Pseudomonadota bacterium]
MFSISDIQTARAVGQLGSIRAAARQLHRTQPAVSQAIRRLEERIGFALFDRSGYRVTPTARGRDFLQQSEILLLSDAHLREYAGVLAKGQESTLALAVWPMFGEARLLPLLQAVAARHPETSIELHYAESILGMDLLAAGRVSIAICPHARPGGHHQHLDVDTLAIGAMTFVCVIAPALLGERDPGAVPREQLARWNQIILRDSASGRSYSFGAERSGRHWAVNDQRLMAALIRDGLGWGLMPLAAVRDELASGALRELQLPEFGSRITTDIVAARVRGKPQGPVASALWALFDGA